MNLRSALKTLLALSIGLPMLQAVLFWIGGLLGAMGDESVEQLLAKFQTAVGVAWLISLVGLVIVLAVNSIDWHDEQDGPAGE